MATQLKHLDHLKPESRAALLSKMRLSRRRVDDLGQDPLMKDYDYDLGTPGFTYLETSLHIQGPSPRHDDPQGECRLWLDICNEGWDRPATAEGLAELEEKLFEWALSEGFFDEDLVKKEEDQKWEVHTGEDYAVVMLPGEVTDTASIRLYGEHREKLATLLEAVPDMARMARRILESQGDNEARYGYGHVTIEHLNELRGFVGAAGDLI